ncbi:putative Aquaporin-10 [Hypsibius exemplaris]|uniref:Aquaporin-10 n=1 Tax=Hypsibius exemplaris TaxID=2072580 RepID=A0A1W0WPW5_HYPEX|nr:putative Aquaporin-10 [Hypsibius exemplaris]
MVVKNDHARRFIAEFFGTYLFVAFSLGCLSQVIYAIELGGQYSDTSAFFIVCVGEGLGLTLGMYAAYGVSGGHLNPIISMALALKGTLSVVAMLVDWLAQYTAVFLAAWSVYALYYNAEHEFLGDTSSNRSRDMTTEERALNSKIAASIFASQPQNYSDPDGIGIWGTGYRWRVTAPNVILNSALFTMIYVGLIDRKNTTTDLRHVPVLSGVLLAVIGLSIGFNCGTALNPARDFCSRVISSVVGWNFNLNSGVTLWWFLVPVILPHLGAIIGLALYQLLIGNHFPKIPRAVLGSDNTRPIPDDGTILVFHSAVKRNQTDRTADVKVIS